MSLELWTAIDRYIAEHVTASDSVLESALEAGVQAGLPQISVAPNQGKLLYLLARMTRARRILEIGTLAGYSTIWLARALPADGRLITLEFDPTYAEVARNNLARAGLSDAVRVEVGPALDTLPRVAPHGPFDLVFIDADKKSIPEYFDWALALTVPGSVIIVDNVVREGAILDPNSDDPSVRAVRRFNERLAAEPRVSATTIQTVGSKGHDGFTIALVNDV
ncbi:MAG: O-methyltransferase [Gemmatimonadaceae bacterium]